MNFSAPRIAGPAARISRKTPVDPQKRMAPSFSSSPHSHHHHGARAAESAGARRRTKYETAADGDQGDEQRHAPEPERRRQREGPADVGDDREADRPREQGGVPAVVEEGAQEREDGQADELRRQCPCQNVPNHCSLVYRLGAAFRM